MSAYCSLDRSHWLLFDCRVPNYAQTRVRSDPIPRHELRCHRIDGSVRRVQSGAGHEGSSQFEPCGSSLQMDVAWRGWTSRDFGLHIGQRRLTKSVCAKQGGLPRPYFSATGPGGATQQGKFCIALPAAFTSCL